MGVLERMQQLGCHTWIFTDFAREDTKHIDVFVGQLGSKTFTVGTIEPQRDPFNSIVLSAARTTLKRFMVPLGLEIIDIPMPTQLAFPEEEFLDTKELERDMLSTRMCWLLDPNTDTICTFQPGDCCSIRRYFSAGSKAHQMTTTSRLGRRWRSYTNMLPVRYEKRNRNFVLVPSFVNSKYNNKLMRSIEKDEQYAYKILSRHFANVVPIYQEWRVEKGGSIHCMTRGVPSGVPLEATICA